MVHKEKWVTAESSVLRWIQEVSTEQELTRSLEWWLILPQVLLRGGPEERKEGPAGQGARMIDARF